MAHHFRSTCLAVFNALLLHGLVPLVSAQHGEGDVLLASATTETTASSDSCGTTQCAWGHESEDTLLLQLGQPRTSVRDGASSSGKVTLKAGQTDAMAGTTSAGAGKTDEIARMESRVSIDKAVADSANISDPELSRVKSKEPVQQEQQANLSDSRKEMKSVQRAALAQVGGETPEAMRKEAMRNESDGPVIISVEHNHHGGLRNILFLAIAITLLVAVTVWRLCKRSPQDAAAKARAQQASSPEFIRWAQGTALMALGALVLSFDSLLIHLAPTGYETLFWRMLFLGGTMQLVHLVGACISTCGIISGFIKVYDDIVAGGAYSLIVMVSYPIPISMLVFALRMTSTADCLVLVGSSPLFSAILSKVILGDNLPVHTAIAILAGMVCVLSIFLFSPAESTAAPQRLAGDILSLVVAITLAVYFIACDFVKRKNGGASVIPVLPFGCYGAALYALAMGANPMNVTGRDMLWLWLMGGVMAPIAIPAFTVAAGMISAPECSLIQLLEMVFAPIWTWMCLGEVPAVSTVVAGSVLVLVLSMHAVFGALHASTQTKES